MEHDPASPMIGVLGGVGPLSSAAFVTSIYERWSGEREQSAPRVVLLSDPSFPDRNDCLLAGSTTALQDRLRQSLDTLCDLGASNIVICCMTLHTLLPEMPERVRRRVTSMLDTTFELVSENPGPHMLLCSLGARHARLFEQQEQWRSVSGHVVLPSLDDQRALQQLIYRIKRGDDLDDVLADLDALTRPYDTESRVAACSELHMLTRHVAQRTRDDRTSWLDPFAVVADRLAHSRQAAKA